MGRRSAEQRRRHVMQSKEHCTEPSARPSKEIGTIPGGKIETLPVLPPSAPTDGDGAKSLETQRLALEAARRFHQGSPAGDVGLTPGGADIVPALLFPFREPQRIRNDYPLFLAPSDDSAVNGQPTAGALAVPLSDLLQETAERFAPGADDARILKDNLLRLERDVRQATAGEPAPVDAATAISDAARRMVRELSLGGANEAQLEEDLGKLASAIPAGGSLLALSEHTALSLFVHAACARAASRRRRLGDDVRTLRAKLHDLRRTDRGKDHEGRAPAALGKSVGASAATHFDPAELARVLGPTRGLAPMSGARRSRIESVVRVLGDYLSRATERDTPLMTVVHGGELMFPWHAHAVDWRAAGNDPACAMAARLFEKQAERYAELFGAVRIARLELAGGYEPERHDPLLDSFGWRSFSADEILALPPIVVLESATDLAGAGMLALSRLLLSGRPLSVLVPVEPAVNPAADGDDALSAGYRFELGYLGVSHRDAAVHQTSVTRPDHLLAGCIGGLDGTRPSLHVIAGGPPDGGDVPDLGAWLHAGAALEGRAHPFFHYDPEAGATWARRFDFEGNPQADEDWPTYALPCRTAEGGEASLELAFTFADFALTQHRYRDHFGRLPTGLDSPDLVAMDEYLGMSPARADECVPFVWATNGDGRLQRMIVTQALAFACRDRLDYWRTLQELAGIRNEHVREAVERAREGWEADLAAERARSAEAHEQELERVRNETAAETMQRLARRLLDTDVASFAGAAVAGLAPASDRAAEAVPADTEAPPAQQAEQTEEPLEQEEAEDAWIDSTLCTSCNDCLEINNRLFVYNSNKQALIGDPTAGTFAEMVAAAEKCPAHCIHPGKPINAHEPNLDALIERAKPFN